MKKIGFYLVLIMLALLAGYLYFYRYKSTLPQKPNKFAVSVDQLNKIVIEKVNGSLVFSKVDEIWNVNGQKTNPELIENMLFVLPNLELVAPASKRTTDSLIKTMINGTTIQLYNGNKLLKSIQITKYHEQIYGRIAGKSNYFRLDVKGYPGTDLMKVFSTDINYWLTRKLFNIDTVNIWQIEMYYARANNGSFKLSKTPEGDFTILLNNNTIPKNVTSKLQTLQYIRTINTIANSHSRPEIRLQDTVKIKKAEFFKLTHINHSNQVEVLTGYDSVPEKIMTNFPGYFLAISSTQGPVLLRYEDIYPLLLPADYFLKK